MNTAPHEIAANSLSPKSDCNSEVRLSPLPPTNPDAIAVNVMYVGALSRRPDSRPDIQKKCQGAFKSRDGARALRISKAGTIVTKIPTNSAATSRMG